ncbi:hypothetical protein Ahy_A09g045056 [Arachis hypogaea]|uniref:Uncharacterized protein n=1 Tax=Arachis hypogaea TaxID=3818 RepID=A0A445BLF2_ARAHY|nr:hypothetical protein Ahy_A09g045056 [Arachis hypogaea]
MDGFANGRLRKREHPKCKCRTYAIICRSRTPENSNRLFFGCPYFKIFGHAGIVDGRGLAFVDASAGEECVVSLKDGLEERVKHLEDLLLKMTKDRQFVKQHTIFALFRSVIIGALLVVFEFCIYVVAV